jgi:hypothetical protein
MGLPWWGLSVDEPTGMGRRGWTHRCHKKDTAQTGTREGGTVTGPAGPVLCHKRIAAILWTSCPWIAARPSTARGHAGVTKPAADGGWVEQKSASCLPTSGACEAMESRRARRTQGSCRSTQCRAFRRKRPPGRDERRASATSSPSASALRSPSVDRRYEAGESESTQRPARPRVALSWPWPSARIRARSATLPLRSSQRVRVTASIRWLAP